MIIYNVTVNVEESVCEEWQKWMRDVHIPEVMRTGFFLGHRFCKVLSTQVDETGETFAIQYECASMEDYVEYQDKHAAVLQKKHGDKYQNSCLAFRTLLEVL